MEAERARLSRLHEPPTDAVQAYNNAPDISATLSFLVPTVSLLSCIPAALAWYNSPPQNGTPHDANFYQLISSNIMQLLGLFLMIWPTAAHTKLAQFARVWTWVLAGASACFTAMAVPLYLCLPTGWSALLSFGGSIAQVLILLQLRHAA